MRFDRPLYLLALLLPVVMLLARIRWHAMEVKRLRTFIRPALWDRVSVSRPAARPLSTALWAMGICLSVVALAGPVWGTGSVTLTPGGENLVVALDVSGSMNSTDETPSRIGRAAMEIADLIRELDDVRVSLVLFASHARLAVPLTVDREFFLSRLPREPGDVTDLRLGTQVGGLVGVMESAAPSMALESRVGILFSDGGFHDHEIESSVERAVSSGMPIITIGVGGLTPSPVPGEDGEPLVDPLTGDPVSTSLEQEPLRRIAEQTGGFYSRLGDAADLPDLVRQILSNTKRCRPEALEAATRGRRFQLFLGLALACFLAARILEGRRL